MAVGTAGTCGAARQIHDERCSTVIDTLVKRSKVRPTGYPSLPISALRYHAGLHNRELACLVNALHMRHQGLVAQFLFAVELVDQTIGQAVDAINPHRDFVRFR